MVVLDIRSGDHARAGAAATRRFAWDFQGMHHGRSGRSRFFRFYPRESRSNFAKTAASDWSNNMTARTSRTASLMAALMLAVSGTGAAAQTVVKVGVINSYSGFLAQPGDELEKGLSLYLKEHGKDLPAGVSIELIRRDDAAAPDVGKRVAQELIAREHVQFLTGVISSPVAAAIAPLTVEAKVPFVLANASGVSLTRLSPYIARVS